MTDITIPDENTGSEKQRTIIEMIKQFATFSQILRMGGAFSVVASMSIFLLQGWDSGNDINRYYLLLSQTVLLAIGGLGLAFLVRENKGARVFFGLSLISVTANLTTLGALIFSYVQWGGALTDYPDYAMWSVSNGLTIIQALGIAALVLIPVSWFGFKIMSRRSSVPLTAAYLLSTLTLLVPVRDTLFSSIIAGVSVLLALIFVTKLTARDTSLRTMEGLFARSLLFIAPVIMLTRSLWLYQADAMIYSIIAATAFMTLRHSSLLLSVSNKYRKVMEFLSIPVVFLFAATATESSVAGMTTEFMLPAFAFFLALPMLDLARRSEVLRRVVLSITGLVVSISFLMQLGIYGGIVNGLSCAVIGMLVIFMGIGYKLKLMTMTGLITLIVALVYDLSEIINMVDLFSWTSLAVTGVLAIIIASIIERHGVTLKLHFDNTLKNIESRMA